MTAAERDSAGIQSLPASLAEAVEELKQNEVMKKMLGEHVFNKFVAGKQIEWDNYRIRVSQWEIDSYLNTY
jgi:glutamine synthetase